MTARILIVAALLLLLAACASNQDASGSSSASEYGYLNLAGSMINREAWVDGTQLGVDPEADSNRVRLKAGPHKLEFRSSNRILRAEDILVEAGQTVEVTVP
ncbi:MAG: hypothetical protein LHW45_05235 [Candidatus Cloacimonetes bacterium]|nr:hypothetical protein [Candidatus Cloacimonadota bacterium]MDY0367012.1 hypothetical protein [Candidatus Syntrophosphaera sp.]